MRIQDQIESLPRDDIAIIDDGAKYSYEKLLFAMKIISKDRLKSGSVVSLIGGWNIWTISKFFVASDNHCIIVPMVKIRVIDEWQCESPDYKSIKKLHVSGLVTSGRKCHNLHTILDSVLGKPKKTVNAGNFESIDGIKKMLECIINGGTFVIERGQI